MSRVEITVSSDVESKSFPDDQEKVLRFREEMATYLSQFGFVAVDVGFGRTRFSSIHDVVSFFLNLPPGEIALKWVEVMIAVQAIETKARQIWADIVPGSQVSVAVDYSIDGRPAGGKVGQSLSKRAIEAPPRLLFAALAVIAAAYFGWFARGTYSSPPERAPEAGNSPVVIVVVENERPPAAGRGDRQPVDRRYRVEQACPNCPIIVRLNP